MSSFTSLHIHDFFLSINVTFKSAYRDPLTTPPDVLSQDNILFYFPAETVWPYPNRKTYMIPVLGGLYVTPDLLFHQNGFGGVNRGYIS